MHRCYAVTPLHDAPSVLRLARECDSLSKFFGVRLTHVARSTE